MLGKRNPLIVAKRQWPSTVTPYPIHATLYPGQITPKNMCVPCTSVNCAKCHPDRIATVLAAVRS